MPLRIRPLAPFDRDAWEPLWAGYQAFYGVSIPREVTDTTWARFHDPVEPMHVLGAEIDGQLVAFAHYIFQRSCWTIGPYCYLQDLFVVAERRGAGLGRTLIEAVCERAKAAGASRVHWLTKEDNVAARRLYDTLAERSGFIQYRRVF